MAHTIAICYETTVGTLLQKISMEIFKLLDQLYEKATLKVLLNSFSKIFLIQIIQSDGFYTCYYFREPVVIINW